MSTLDLDAVPIIENEMKDLLEPFAESTKRVKDFLSLNQSTINDMAESFSQMVKNTSGFAQSIQMPELGDSFKQMQALGEAARLSLNVPDLTPVLPLEFGRMSLDIFDQNEVILPDSISLRSMSWQDKEDIADLIAEKVAEQGTVTYSEIHEEQPTEIEEKESITHLAVFWDVEGNEISVVVNRDYSTIITRQVAGSWEKFVMALGKHEFNFNEHKWVWDSFNGKSSLLYKRTGCKPTRIFGQRNGKVVVRVPVESVTKEELAERANETA